MENEEFLKIAGAVVEALPKEFKNNMENIDIVIDDMVKKDKNTLVLGLYEGVPLSKRGVFYGGALPDKITLFKKNIESISRNDKEIKDNIKTVIIHEIAHHFGFDEKEIRKRGF